VRFRKVESSMDMHSYSLKHPQISSFHSVNQRNEKNGKQEEENQQGASIMKRLPNAPSPKRTDSHNGPKNDDLQEPLNLF
jgi:hypothetical protein